MSLRDTILTATDIEEQVEDVPEWGVKVRLRGMTGAERLKLVERSTAKDRTHMYADVLISQTFDPDTGDKVFDPADRDALSDKSGAVLERLALIVTRDLSGIGGDDEVETDPTSGGS